MNNNSVVVIRKWGCNWSKNTSWRNKRIKRKWI
jgi:hypothetical protein